MARTSLAFPVAVGRVGHVAALLNGPLEAPAQAFIDDLVLPAGHECLELRKLIVNFIRQVIHLVRRDDQGVALSEGV